MSLRAYQQAAQRAETPRDVEYRLFAQVTRALLDLKSTPREDLRAWIDVLHWNRRIWAALADDCSTATNALPEEVRRLFRNCRMRSSPPQHAVASRSWRVSPARSPRPR